MSSNSSEKTPSISDIINKLKSAFRNIDYLDAEKQLASREHDLKHRLSNVYHTNEILDSELTKLKLDQISQDTERCRLTRVIEVLEDQLSDLTRDLGVSRDSEAKALKRYDRVQEYARKLEYEKEELARKFEEDNARIVVRLRELQDDYNGLHTELVGLRHREEVLEEEKAKLDDEVVGLKMKLSEKEARIVTFSVQKREIDGLRTRIAVLEGEKTELERERNLRIDQIQVEKNQKILRLERENEKLENENLELKSLIKKVDEDFKKVQGDVISTLWFNVDKGKRLASSKIGKIFAGVKNQLDAEDGVGDLPSNGDLKKDSGFDLLAKGPKSLLKSKTKSEEATISPLIHARELSLEDANRNKKLPCPPGNFIRIPSDDENDGIPPRHSGLKRKLDFSSSLIYIDDDGSIDDSLNKKGQTKKMKGEQDETPLRRQSVAASESDHKFSTPERQAASESDHKFSTPERQSLADIRKFEDTVCREPKGLKAADLADVDKCFNSSSKTKNFLSPHLKEAMVKCQEKLKNRSVDCSTDIIWNSMRDSTFCCKAVCALYRQHNSLVTSGSKLFRDSDVERGISLAKYLMDGSDNFDMKKSADELDRHDPRGLDDCRGLVMYYSKELFEIYMNKVDPLFSPDK